jgi:hypothetical protein
MVLVDVVKETVRDEAKRRDDGIAELHGMTDHLEHDDGHMESRREVVFMPSSKRQDGKQFGPGGFW